MSEVAKPTLPEAPDRRLLLPAAAAAVLLFLVVGGLGLYRYLDSYWLYRGFPPPKDPAFVKQQGTTQTIHVTSAAIGQRGRVDTARGYASECPRKRSRASQACALVTFQDTGRAETVSACSR